MKTIDVTIQHEGGVHARPASIFVREASRFKSDVRLTAGEITVNGKSIMGLLMLALSNGASVRVETEGNDEADAAAHLADLLAGDFA